MGIRGVARRHQIVARAKELSDPFASNGGFKYRLYAWWYSEVLWLNQVHIWKDKYYRIQHRYKKVLLESHQDPGVMDLPLDVTCTEKGVWSDVKDSVEDYDGLSYEATTR
jgi:hypothetical protein